MAYIPYPQPPTNPNGYQVAGAALQQAAGYGQDYEDRQQKLRSSLEEMTQRRANAILSQQESELRQKKLEQDTKLASEAEQRAHDFALEAARGKVVSPTLAKDPSLSRRPASREQAVGTPSAGEMAALENVDGLNMPSQPVRAGGDATAMLGEALERSPVEGSEGRVPRTREELLDLGLENRQLDLKDYASATKPEKPVKGQDPALMARYFSDFLPQVAPLLKRLKKDPTVASDIAYMGEQQGLGGLEVYQKFIDNLKGGNTFNQMGMDRFNLAKEGQQFQNLQSLAKRMEDDPSLKSIQRREIFEQTANTAYNEYLNAPESAKGEARRQADQQLLFSLAKIRDEGVVMPGEFDRETKGQGWIQEKINALKSGVEGGLKMDDSQRAYIIALMGKFRANAIQIAKPRYEYFRAQGEKYGDADFVTGTWDGYFQGAPAEPATAPAPGPRPTPPPAAVGVPKRFKEGLTQSQRQLVAFAKQNPKDPRAAVIFAKYGVN